MLISSLVFKPETLAWVNGLLSGEVPHTEKRGNTMIEWTAVFPDGCEADLKVVSCGRTGEEDAELPYVDAILFSPGGTELGLLDPVLGKIDGIYQWDPDGPVDCYVLEVKQEG